MAKCHFLAPILRGQSQKKFYFSFVPFVFLPNFALTSLARLNLQSSLGDTPFCLSFNFAPSSTGGVSLVYVDR